MTTRGLAYDDPGVLAEARRRAPICDRCGGRMKVSETRLAQVSYQCLCGRIVSGDYWSQVARDVGEPSTADQLHGPAEQRGPRPERSNPTIDRKANPMLDTTTSEVTGIRSAVARLEEIAKTHEQIGTGEGFLGSLNRMEVGDEDKQLYRDAQEASRNAGRLWAHAASEVRAHNLPVSQAYSVSPGAGNKQANTNE